jgi:hypothetical protein
MGGPDLIGLSGALIAGYAHLPQIRHLTKEHCSAGISRSAFALWFLASILVTINALFIHAVVFVALGIIQISSTGVISSSEPISRATLPLPRQRQRQSHRHPARLNVATMMVSLQLLSPGQLPLKRRLSRHAMSGVGRH